MGINNDNSGNISRKDKIFIQFILLMFCALLFRPGLDNDTYWLLNTGKYILENGFPTVEPFTIHEGLKFIPQQWLTTVAYYTVYEQFGTSGLYVFAIAIFYFIVFMIYKIAVVVSEGNIEIAAKIAIFTCIPLMLFMVLRPQIISMSIFLIEIYLLESYIASRNKRYLIGLPILSLFLINFHAAMWVFYFVLLAPYIIDSYKFKIKSIEGQGYPTKPLLVVLGISIVVGLINPYGFESMVYIFKSYGYSHINAYINEMQSPDFKNAAGVFIFSIYLIIIVLYYVNAKKGKTTRLRYLLITMGTAYMGLSSVRSTMLFVICSFPLTACYFKDSVSNKVDLFKGRHMNFKIALLIILIMAGNYVKFERFNFVNSNPDIPSKAAKFIINNKLQEKGMRLYNGYNEGAYLEFVGIKAFVDPRAEVFLKVNNGKEDILNDYFDTITGKMHYGKLAEKYELTHFLVEKKSLVDIYLLVDAKYKLIYEDEIYRIFENENVQSLY